MNFLVHLVSGSKYTSSANICLVCAPVVNVSILSSPSSFVCAYVPFFITWHIILTMSEHNFFYFRDLFHMSSVQLESGCGSLDQDRMN